MIDEGKKKESSNQTFRREKKRYRGMSILNGYCIWEGEGEVSNIIK